MNPLSFVVSCSLLILALAGTAKCDSAAANLLPNPGFELADGGGVAFWEKRTPDDGLREMVWSADVSRTGERSVGIVGRGMLSRWRTGHLRDIVLEPGSECELSGWIKTQGLSGRANLRLYLCDRDGGIIAQPASRMLAEDTDWTRVSITHAVPNVPVYAMAYLELEGTGAAWFDDVSLTGTLSSEGPGAVSQPVTFGPDDFWELTGYRPVTRAARRVIEIPPDSGVDSGTALLYFVEDTARYDVTIEYLDEPDGASTVTLSCNGRALSSHVFDQTTTGTDDVAAKWTIEGVDLQRNSRILLTGRADQGEYCRIVSVTLTPVGRFEGELLGPEDLPPLPSLLVYERRDESRVMRGMLPEFLNRKGTSKVSADREAQLAALKTPEDWAQYQRDVRSRLDEIWGQFPEKTPLNARVVGVIERDEFSIEKVIYEGRPGYFVTANFYKPKGRQFPVPGVIFVCGHANEGKGYHLYHECCLGLVLKGYAVLAIDPTGQGERSEYFDPETLKQVVPTCVPQHHQLGRPSLLVNQTLGGYRVWDAIRGVDYLLSRPEVDPDRLASVGNSGGGQMSFLVAAADERIDVCVAAHPGGSMENTYLTGSITDRDVLALIPPRPCRVVVGKDSGEGYHEAKVKDMQRFYRGLGYDESRCEMHWVDGVHDMKQPKREASYEWLNRWLGKEDEDWREPPLEPFSAEELWCTESGFTVKSLGGETGQSLNAKRMQEILPERNAPADLADAQAVRDKLKQAVAKRIGFELDADREPPATTSQRTLTCEGFSAEMLTIHSEEGMTIPAALLRPNEPVDKSPVIVHAAERGKPARAGWPSLPVELCRQGLTVLTIDVRGAGETDPGEGRFASTVGGYNPDDWRRDALAINSYAYIGRTMPAMCALDVVRACDFLHSTEEFAGRPIIVVGEGIGGLWALFAAAYDEDIEAVVTHRTLLSLKMLVEEPYHEVRGYFSMPGALEDFDIHELTALLAPREVLWLDPVDNLARPMALDVVAKCTEWTRSMSSTLGAEWTCLQTQDAPAPDVARQVSGFVAATLAR